MPPHFVSVLGLIRTDGENKMSKRFKLLTYPLSYSSLQEEAVTKENTTHIKHSLQKKEQINDRLKSE